MTEIITGSRTFYIQHKILHYLEKFMKNLFFIKKNTFLDRLIRALFHVADTIPWLLQFIPHYYKTKGPLSVIYFF